MNDIFSFKAADLDKYFVGADRVLKSLTSANELMTKNIPGYPPYNIVKTGDNSYTIELAVAGFAEDQAGGEGIDFFGELPIGPANLLLAGDQGRPIGELDLELQSQVVVIGAAIAEALFPRGIDPLDKRSLDGSPADNITPAKVLASARFTELGGRWWAEYGIRMQTKVTRVTPTLYTSPFRIAQDFLSLDGFVVQRIGWGVDLSRGRRERLGLVFAVENLANRYYREQFQFAPSRGRTFTMGLNVGAFEGR